MSPKVCVPPLTAVEQKELAKLIRSGRDASIVRRAQMIQLKTGGDLMV